MAMNKKIDRFLYFQDKQIMSLRLVYLTRFQHFTMHTHIKTSRVTWFLLWLESELSPTGLCFEFSVPSLWQYFEGIEPLARGSLLAEGNH